MRIMHATETIKGFGSDIFSENSVKYSLVQWKVTATATLYIAVAKLIVTTLIQLSLYMWLASWFCYITIYIVLHDSSSLASFSFCIKVTSWYVVSYDYEHLAK